MPVLLKRNERLAEGNPGYTPFMDSLEATYNLHEMPSGELKWVGLDDRPGSIYFPPLSVLSAGKDHPALAVSLYPMVNGQCVTVLDTYQASLLMRDVQPWSHARNWLGDYRVVGLKGVPEEKSMFEKPKGFSEVLQMIKTKSGKSVYEKLPDDTDVVEAVVFLPIAVSGEFRTEFKPTIRLDPLGHCYYDISLIDEDRLSAYGQLTEGNSTRHIDDIDERKNKHNWQAVSVPDLSDIEQLFLPSSAGHMILVATPYEKPKPKLLPDFGYDFGSKSYGDDLGFGGGMRGGFFGSPTFSMQTKGGIITAASLRRGTKTGEASLYEGELLDSDRGNPVIFHIRYLCFRPDQAKQLTPDVLDELGKSLSKHQTV